MPVYTEIGRIMSKKEATATLNMVRNAQTLPQVNEIDVNLVNDQTGAKITVHWQRALGDNGREIVEVEYNSADGKIGDYEFFKCIEDFSDAYQIK
jgi:hypothetical protein